MGYIIYKITNKITNKSYIGRTVRTLKQRMYSHFYVARTNPKCYFHNAINKYGEEAWDVQVLEEGDGDDQISMQREMMFIAEHGTYKDGYNSTPGGEDFTSSDYQRELQLNRVRRGEHPFLGGKIQSETMKRRHKAGEFKNQNAKRIEEGTHHFIGDRHPQKRISALGLHHNQNTKAWRNTKTAKNEESIRAWSLASEMYDWYQLNGHKKRGGSYVALANAFNFKPSIVLNINKYFRRGWVPTMDEEWLDFKLNFSK